MKERIDSCINDWKRRLIDLTRRNRLIYFVPKRSSSLQIAEPTPSEVFNRFVIEEKPLKCFIPEEDDESSETPIQSELPLGDLEKQSKSNDKRQRRSEEIICKTQESRVLRSVLRNLERRSRSDFEERGVRILHLAFGILESSDKPSENDNLLFYGDITKYSQKEYIENMEKYFGEKIGGNKRLEDLCGQIIVNSQITSTKFNIFKVTAWLMIIGQILFLISFWR